MTLPRGFGSGWDFRDKDDNNTPKKRCWLGNQCEKKTYRNNCKFHKWTHDHRDIYIGLWVIVAAGCFVALIYTALSWNDIVHAPIIEDISGFNCNQLAQYIADKNKVYNYAEHRYEWLCVNEQVKEFQG